MIGSIIIVLAFIWLGYETDWMRVRLLVGAYTPVIEQSNRKWQFLKYGDDALQLCSPCFCQHYSECHSKTRDEYVWLIPARTVRAFGSTMSFNKGCNRRRGGLLRDIAREQKSRALPTYHAKYDRVACFPLSNWSAKNLFEFEPTMDILVDGELKASINGNFKRGAISTALKPYTTKLKVGKHPFIAAFGEADRVKA